MILTTLRRGLLACVLFVHAGVGASPIDLVIFGDSLSDTGNVFGLTAPTGFPVPPSPYFAGRFSNGPVWVDHLAAHRGLGPVNNVFLTGSLAGQVNNFAAGGAYAGSYEYPPGVGPGTSSNANDRFYSPPLPPFLPGLQEQVSLYGAVTGGIASPDAWHVVWAGANDLVFADFNGSTADALATGAVASVRTAIEDLAAMGATEFLVPNLPDIGFSPFGIGTGRTVELSIGTSIFNAGLAAMIADLESLLGIDIMLLDVHALFAGLTAAVVADPVAAGFPGGFGPCVDPATLVDLCSAGGLDPNDFVFWDALHPSSRTHSILANAFIAAKAIPEPGSLALATLALFGVVRVTARVRQPGR